MMQYVCTQFHEKNLENPFIMAAQLLIWHYENTPIQIYWKFYHQKNEKNSDKKNLIFFMFLLKNIDYGY